MRKVAQGAIYAANNPRRKRRGRRGRPPRRSTDFRKFARRGSLVVLAAGAFVAGVLVADRPSHDAQHLVTRYVTAWTHDRVASMYAMLDPASKRRMSEAKFDSELTADADTATATSFRAGKVPDPADGVVSVPMTVRTRLWGTLRETLRVPVTGSGSSTRVQLAPEVLFPGLRGAELLHRHTVLPTRGTLLASDGTPLAEGPARYSPIPQVAIQIVGTLESIPKPQAAHYTSLGYPADAKVGEDGLEHIFQKRLAGQVGGTLLAGHRVLAHVKPVKAKPIHTTINPGLETAAVQALGGQYAGMAVMDPHTGGLEALAGIAFSALQPPGSTMKIVTTTAALQYHAATPATTFPEASSATVGGYTLSNAGGEVCGGTLVNAFAVSCNSVFAPLGVKVGAKHFLATAERFGFNHPSAIPGAQEPSVPPKSLDTDAELGPSAIGQGLVQATPLTMADVGTTIADHGRRPIPTLDADAKPRFVHVTTPKVASEVQGMMEEVVRYGTGTAAQIPGVVVAGKTGTSQIENGAGSDTAGSLQNTDAWFVGYAPAGAPQVVAAALFPNAGAGGDAAAPSVRDVLEYALEHH
jgi:penicillin-binding protein A